MKMEMEIWGECGQVKMKMEMEIWAGEGRKYLDVAGEERKKPSRSSPWRASEEQGVVKPLSSRSGAQGPTTVRPTQQRDGEGGGRAVGRDGGEEPRRSGLV